MSNTKELSFAIELPTTTADPKNFYKKGLMKVITDIRKDYPGFTVAGIDAPVVKRGIEFASNGNLITVGTAKTHDVEWVERTNYARSKGYNPVLDVITDWDKIVARMTAYAELHHGAKEVNLGGGRVAIIHRNFVKIGYKCYNYRTVAAAEGLTVKDIEAIYRATR